MADSATRQANTARRLQEIYARNGWAVPDEEAEAAITAEINAAVEAAKDEIASTPTRETPHEFLRECGPLRAGG